MDVKGLWALIYVLVVVGCSLVLVSLVSPAVVADTGAESHAVQEFDDGEPDEIGQLDDADEVHIDAFVHENRTATFTVDYRFANDSTADWETLRDAVEENPDAYAAAEQSDWNETLADGINETGREEMEISNVSVSTDTSPTPRNLGHVEFTFEWSLFAHVELTRMEAGDALAGFTLSDDTTLQLFWPDAYTLREANPTPDDSADNSVFWDGDGTEFASDQPWIVLIENGDGVDEPGEPGAGPEMPWLAVAGALALLVTAGAVGWLIRHRAGDNVDSPADTRAETVSQPPESPPSSEAQPPPELLSNEERVLRLLEQRGGRIKQQEVVSELGWTEAKTSQVVGGLREDDEIEVFRIGRENVLALPDEE
ncbi:helix-turn-helix transcriptional regulator [Natrialbaceae archaeon A-arb3/5]